MKSPKRKTTNEENNPAIKREISRSGDHYSNNSNSNEKTYYRNN